MDEDTTHEKQGIVPDKAIFDLKSNECIFLFLRSYVYRIKLFDFKSLILSPNRCAL